MDGGSGLKKQRVVPHTFSFLFSSGPTVWKNAAEGQDGSSISANLI